MAGVVATKLLAAGGAGGVALTIWALRAAGLRAVEVVRRMMTFEVLLYAVFMGSLVLVGGGLASGAFAAYGPRVLTVLPAAFGVVVIALALAMRVVPGRIERYLSSLAGRVRRGRSFLTRLQAIPRTLQDGIVAASGIIGRPQPELLGAIAYWGFDIATLWAGFRAFGAAPPLATIIMCDFLGQLGNVIPLPGGVGGVEGGMIGSFIAFGVNGSVAVLAVLAYRLISFWLPIVPGSVAYLQLRRTVARWNAAAVTDGQRDQTAPRTPRSGRTLHRGRLAAG